MNSRIAGVIGWPAAHSLSPKLHGYWLRTLGVGGEYVAWPVRPEALESFITTMAGKGFAGCNVTIPHKEAVFNLLRKIGEVDDTAIHAGAVNTIIVKTGGILHGTNTDVYGFTENVRPHLTGKNKAVIFGAGGAARAIGRALIDLAFNTIIIANRTLARADAIGQQFGRRLEIASWQERAALLENSDLLVNATSLGMAGKPPLEIDLSSLPGHALVTDVVYTPLETPLLAEARARGNPAVDGLGMLLHQAAPGFAAWFGVKPEVTDALRRYMLA
ncbi:MAG: shikimate dehydrogenase [Pseudomonadota bacterium]|nr:shikimate dehydrogenase [Pseudomonadota bacterium]MDE3038350.1 shikimate dehydrogenase [Pseudomonadota bacterium]